MSVRVGVDIGWLGFPGNVTPPTPCFFGGKVSAYLPDEKSYLVDGVAIHGVSGSPAFFLPTNLSGESHVFIMGIVTEYRPNRTTGEALPGLSMLRDLFFLHASIAAIESLEQARDIATTRRG